MSFTAPKIDARSAADISAELRELLQAYAPTWNEFDPVSGAATGTSAALIGIFARYAEIVIERLNQVPDKNFLAFMDLLGAARLPPQSARVPLTFTLAAGSAIDAQVPAGTQVAAPPPPGAKDPVVFETERPLVVTAVQLASLLTIDPEQDSYGDWTAHLAAPAAFPVFQGDHAFEHVLYLGDSQLLSYVEIKNLRVRITLAAQLPKGADLDARAVRWEHWDGSQWQLLKPTQDPTANLTLSGTIHFGDIPPLSESAVNLRTSRWLRCRLLTPITQSAVAEAGMVRANQLPVIKRIITAVHLERTVAEGIAPDLGFTNGAPLDLSKEFFPLGEKPKLHDTLFLASAEAFSKDRTTSLSYSSARVELDVVLANSHLVPGAASVRPSIDLGLAWECWTGDRWQKVGASAAPTWLNLLELDAVPAVWQTAGAVGVTKASPVIQGTAQVGAELTVAQRVPQQTGSTSLVIGADGRFAYRPSLSGGVNVFEFTASFQGRSVLAWAAIFSGKPTLTLQVDVPDLPVDSDMIKLPITLRGDTAQVKTIRITNGITGAVVEGSPAPTYSVTLTEGRNDLLVEALGGDGTDLAAITAMLSRRAAAPPVDADEFSDGTFGLSQSGVVTLRLPATMAKTAVNGEENFWLRVRLVRGDYGKEASYVLKDPVSPEDGFTLVPANFRAPIVAVIKIGYELTPRRSPEVCFTYNQLSYTDCTVAATGDEAAFAPFVAATEAEWPGLYLGFSLPAGRSTFPNTTISLYQRLAEPKYGERAVPLSPEISTRVGDADSTVTHRFSITNAAVQSEDFDIALLGYRWATLVGATSPVTIAAGAAYSFDVQVSIPHDAVIGGSDRGAVRITKCSEPDKIYTAIFTTDVNVLASGEPAAIAWQYWDGTDWSKLTVQDDSENFTRSGLLEFLAPVDMAKCEQFGFNRYWLRAEWEKGEYVVPPRLGQVLLNTTLALQTITVSNEILGSSNGAEGQQFKSARAPVLAGQRLEVRESELPSAEDMQVLAEDEGEDAVTVVVDATGRPREIWVRWHEVPDFYGSGARDRHYVINHISGEIRFGDGLNGRVPPPGSSNLRLTRYQTGGGTAGNSAAGTVAQLKTTVPYVDKAVNPEAAAGGAEAETNDALLARMPQTLRHCDRAVTLEDYEDLALLATTEVARARCVPLRDLKADEFGLVTQPGAVSVIVVPRSADGKPLPTLELLSRVQDFLAERAPATANPSVVGPMYIRVDVTAEIAVSEPTGASVVERAVHARLAAFLHPLTGGLDGNGWDFGRAPHRSDFFALIETVAGVDHVRYLQLTEEDRPDVRQTGRFLVYSGEHQINLVFEES
jgi:hypothetical protein